MIAYLIINWNNIGDNVASHYNSVGQIDSWGFNNTSYNYNDSKCIYEWGIIFPTSARYTYKTH